MKLSGFADARLRAASDRLAALISKQLSGRHPGGTLTALTVLAVGAETT